MLIVYYSLTGNVVRFVAKTKRRALQLPLDERINEPYVIVTPTTGFGCVPAQVERFLGENSALLRGVAASGNVNWGANYGKAADIIAAKYHVPIIGRFELAGTDEDVRKFNEGVDALSRSHISN
ncbi:ribonucleotide reductase assembly protein NrdI [Paenibacillus sp. BIHB 4019]|uniref:Protein NrdI n=1 Tax=Paenibacillus sp. BIHB 4019 TaxID=1870819 RepID=A0A1B2DJ04_9BACL|nr:class Ib ribonucleoside-diphosphate reductase assembly flavoprotein NrdI [Paenibacillus sp. BIHB 4019]ANY67707.1 ribonucleotide reductase assembly protein NrdI [Paenibacillus sp. BIHB 4019]